MIRTVSLPSLLAAALVAAASLASVPSAEAGSGVRLNFGGPLGTFVARPTPGHGGSGYGGGSAYSGHKKPAAKAPHHARRVPAEKPARAVARAVPVAPKTPVVVDTATDTTTPVTGTKSLAAGTLPRLETVTALLPDETVTAVDAPAAATAEPVAPAPKPATRTVDTGPQDCKKFIPAVGVTVTVGCSK